MPGPSEELRSHLQAFDFPRLFVEGMGWNHFQVEPLVLPVDGHEYALKPVAEKADFAVFECGPGPDGVIPEYPVRRKIETQVTKRAFEHLIIFVDAARTQQVWQWVKRQAGKPTACREHKFHTGQTGQPLLQRLDGFIVTLEDEAKGIGITDVVSLIGKAFDVEKVTKRFYERFRTELTAFGEFIDGITAQGDRGWYASLMLNRMMFVYFVQKQGFLDGDLGYLRNRLEMVRNRSGDGRFQQFYRIFLLRLFHEGLGQPEAQRAPDLADLLGKVPFLNGGLFDVHELERDNPDISIPDAAFERVFDFFDGYRWHLDERPYREDNEINPDVLGYIFEKYVNQKQMGAYYTKEDITGYISRNTVIPFLFDAAKKECPVAFGPDGGVWRLLRDDPDRYIYPAVGHGITWNAREAANPKRLAAPFELPAEIVDGIDDVSQRGGWNRPAPEEYALPTETWREVVARRQRHQEVHAKLASGKVQEINDLITLNLDIERFALDVIAQSEGPELLRAFWHAMRDVSVLDPTCGSGAFLFAALNILEPLYTGCLEGMRGFLDDAERSERKRNPEHLGDFRRILEQVDRHPSERYFILKSIVLNNLYGVDIMEEAVEICKLRLFLKLVAQLETYDQIEPLPDIDFNVRAGNTLVGFTSLDAVRRAMTIMPNGQHRQVFPEDQAALDRINEEAEIASAAFNQFRRQQTMLGGEVTSADKEALHDRLRSLGDELDRLLAAEYGVDPKKAAAFDAWRSSHQPFHWFVEFYGIMSKGGFDVVIGNPPYVEYSKVKGEYSVKGYETEDCGNLYAMCIQRFVHLLGTSRKFGVIVPISSVSTPRMLPLMRQLASASSIYISNFAVRPAKLFVGVDMNLSILIGASHANKGRSPIKTTSYNRWNNVTRDYLFSTIAYVDSEFHETFAAILKSGSDNDSIILSKLTKYQPLGHLRRQRASTPIFYHSGGRYFRKCIRTKLSNEYKELSLTEEAANPVLCLLSSSLYYWLWIAVSDCYHVTRTDVDTIPIPDSTISDQRFHELADALTDDLERNAEIRVRRRADGSEREEVKRSVDPVKKEERGKGVCLYVTGENGQRCGNPVDNNCHVIPESKVLDELKDQESKKVLELRWGAARWEHYYATSRATNSITPNNLDEFEPQSVVTGNACVGRFACKCTHPDHDNEFSPIDVKELDFNDPRVPVLSMYRVALYEADLCRVGNRLMEQHNQKALRHVPVQWNKLKASLQSRTQWSEATSERLGKIWHRWKTHEKLDADAVSVRVLNFRSSLKFAACVFSYEKYVIVTVSPLGGDRHKMGVLHLSDDTEAATEATERLSRLAYESENSTNYGVNVLKNLMTYGAGSVAASPESYPESTEGHRWTA